MKNLKRDISKHAYQNFYTRTIVSQCDKNKFEKRKNVIILYFKFFLNFHFRKNSVRKKYYNKKNKILNGENMLYLC